MTVVSLDFQLGTPDQTALKHAAINVQVFQLLVWFTYEFPYENKQVGSLWEEEVVRSNQKL